MATSKSTKKGTTSARSHGREEKRPSKSANGRSRSASARSGSSRSTASRSTPSRSSSRSSASRGRQVEGAAQKMTDHDEIRRWAEERRGKPACVRGTGGGGDTGMLRIDFPGYSGKQSLQPISWDEWFEKFDEKQLALLYQHKTKGGQKSNFNKLVAR